MKPFLAALFIISLSTACQAKPLAAPPSKMASGVTFEKKKLQIGTKTILVEIADDPIKRERGLMFREKLEEGSGMLFIFEEPQILRFWMKNTLIPLSIGYFDENQKLLEVHEMTPAIMGEQFPKTYPSDKPAKYALELPKGWFARNKVGPGAKFSLGK